jgi:UDP-N-acetylglucosamine 1-carboxyvinyltransferase
VEAAPWPYLPVDLLPIFVALGVRAEGSDDVLEQGLRRRHGLDQRAVQVRRARLHVRPAPHHHLRRQAAAPAEVDSPYIIRVAIALLMLAASIPGCSTIRNAAPIRRAHPRFAENISGLGARVQWREEQ